jgi:cyanate permease
MTKPLFTLAAIVLLALVVRRVVKAAGPLINCGTGPRLVREGHAP